MAHKRLSSSQTKRWKECPGSVPLLELIETDNSSGHFAQMGTCAHLVIETALGEGKVPADYEDRIVQIKNPDTSDEEVVMLKPNAKAPGATATWFIVDQDMVEATTCMTDYVHRRMAELWPDQYNGNPRETLKAIKAGHLILEGHTNPLPEREDTGGTADVTLDCWPEIIEIVDYKNGSGVFVPVEKNDQLRNYAAGRWAEADYSHSAVKYTICQPRHTNAPADGIMSEEVSPEELKAWIDDLREAAKRVDDASDITHDLAVEKDPPEIIMEALYQKGLLSTGPEGSACTWCSLVNSCPAAKAKVQEVAAMDFDDDPEDLDPPTGPNHFAMILPWIPFLDKFCKEAMANAENYALTGGTIEGYKLVRGKSNRKWKDGDEKELEDELVKRWKLKKADLRPPAKLITGPQAEKLVPAKMRPQFNAEMLQKPEGKLTLVPNSDKKPAVDVNPGDDFDDEPGA